MTLEERLARLETQVQEIYDVLEQIAKDADLVSANVMRVLRGMQPEKPKMQEKQWTWNPDKIKWIQESGFKGVYERSEDYNNTEFKAMLKDLAEHKGKLERDGRFYWIFQNGATVGRKELKK